MLSTTRNSGTAGFSLSHSDASRAFGRRDRDQYDDRAGAHEEDREWRADGNTAERLVSPGVVERVTAKDGHVEWDFVLAGTSRDGDLRISATIDANGPGSAKRRDQWPAGSERTMRMGELVVVDAPGDESSTGRFRSFAATISTFACRPQSWAWRRIR